MTGVLVGYWEGILSSQFLDRCARLKSHFYRLRWRNGSVPSRSSTFTRDKQHNVRCMYGNGLRPDVWLRFRDRFGVEEVVEFFNSSEGMLSLFNWKRGDFQINCVGHHGAIIRLIMGRQFIPVVVNHETNELVRDPKTGFVKRNSYEEGGEIIVRIPEEASFGG